MFIEVLETVIICWLNQPSGNLQALEVHGA
jgi:hypothetical protein